MSLLENINFEKEKLLALYLGGSVPGFSIEAHDVVFVVAKHFEEVIPKVRELWHGDQKSLHIDSWLPLENLNGFDISLVKSEPVDQVKSLYFVNLGGYLKGQFGEAHYIKFVAADSKVEAKKIAKSQVKEEVEVLHTDDLLDIDECIKITQVDNYFFELTPGQKENRLSTNGWQKLPKPTL